MMNRLELEHQKSAQVQGRSQHILQLTRSTSDSSLEDRKDDSCLTDDSNNHDDETTPKMTNSKHGMAMKTWNGDIESVYQGPSKNKSNQAATTLTQIADQNETESKNNRNSNEQQNLLANIGSEENNIERTADQEASSTPEDQPSNCFSTLQTRTTDNRFVSFCKYRFVTVLLLVSTILMGSYNLKSDGNVHISFGNATGPLLSQQGTSHQDPPANDPLMTILWKHTLLLADEMAVGLWQPPLNNILLEGLSPQYQAYLFLHRTYGTELPPTQVLLQEYALATLYYATNGPEWTESSHWLNATSSICSWFTKEPACNQHGRLVSLNLNENGLVGSIPPELGMLQDLQYLQLSLNHLTGTLPAALAKLLQLKQFDVSFNQLMSTLPNSYGTWIDLVELRVDHNKFSGTFPSSYSSLTKVQRLHLEFNNFQGPIETKFCDFAYGKCQNLGQNFEFVSDCNDDSGATATAMDCKCCTCCPVERGLCEPNCK